MPSTDLKKIHSVDPSEREIATKTILFFGPEKAYEAVPDILFELNRHKGPVVIDLSFRVNGIQALSTIFRYKKNPDQKLIDDAYALYRSEEDPLRRSQRARNCHQDHSVLRAGKSL